MASLDDILTTQKNGVVGINSIVNAQNRLAGTNQTKEISTTTQVKGSAGWFATICVIVAGSGTGTVYDTNAVTSLTGNRIYIIPTTVGVYPIMIPFGSGLVVAPGSGMVVSVSYS